MGILAATLEHPARRVFGRPRVAGIGAAVTVVLIVMLVTGGFVYGTRTLHPVLGILASVLVIYVGMAARDLWDHAEQVRTALLRGDLPLARSRVGMICGRDTEHLDESEIVRATVESVAENMVDGITAPLFFAVLGGPVAIMGYKAVSTLDSTFGYMSEQYREFGWASARLDDVAAFLPSRLTAMIVPLAALMLGERPGKALRVFFRDRFNHPSPNAAQCEAAVAGALGVQLGGTSTYFGKPSAKPFLGDPDVPLETDHIRRACRLMLVTTGLTAALLLSASAALRRLP
jgi:adenosylcobinamide-phosphate synthase